MNLPEFIGLDIGSSSVRIAKVQYGRGDKPQIVALAQSVYDRQVESFSDPATQEYISQKIKELLDSEKIDTRKAVAALPEAMIFSKMASVPDLPEVQLEQMLYYELKNHIPVNPNEVQKDYIVLGPDPANPKLIKILLIAAPKALVEIYRSIAREAKLDLIALETETVALARLVSLTQENTDPVLIADFGFKGVDLCLLHKNKILYSQSIGTGSDALTRSIMSEFNVTYQQAEQYKIKIGLDENQQDGKVLKSLLPIMHIITNEMNKLTNYFKTSIPESMPKSIYLLGEGAMLPGIEGYITKALGLNSVKFDAVKKIELEKNIKKEFEPVETLGYSVAVGLALKQE